MNIIDFKLQIVTFSVTSKKTFKLSLRERQFITFSKLILFYCRITSLINGSKQSTRGLNKQNGKKEYLPQKSL